MGGNEEGVMVMAMARVEVHVDLVCMNCGNGLSSCSAGDDKIQVYPCSTCRSNEMADGYKSGRECGVRDEQEKLVDWILHQLADRNHGCLDGDCPHDKQSGCVESILNYYVECGGENG